MLDVLFCIKVTTNVRGVNKSTFDLRIKDILSVCLYKQHKSFTTAFSTLNIQTSDVWAKHIVRINDFINHFLFSLVTDIFPAVNQINTIYSFDILFFAFIFINLVKEVGPVIFAVKCFFVFIFLAHAIV